MINFFFPSDYSEMLFYTSTYHMQENLYKGSNNKELNSQVSKKQKDSIISIGKYEAQKS